MCFLGGKMPFTVEWVAQKGAIAHRPEVWAERGFALLFEIEIQFI